MSEREIERRTDVPAEEKDREGLEMEALLPLSDSAFSKHLHAA